MNADGSGKRMLTRNASLGRGAWSPDGRKLAFVRHEDRGVLRRRLEDRAPPLLGWAFRRGGDPAGAGGEGYARARRGGPLRITVQARRYSGPVARPTTSEAGAHVLE
jgi:hypothetical protein